MFKILENAQNTEKIVSIFGNNKPNSELKPNPLLVILVGSPGVGKTTKAKEFLERELNVDYNKFYNISLDSLVERVKPYRNATKRLYNTLKNKRGTEPLTNENYALLSEAYLQTIMTNKSDFKLPNTTQRILNKISGLNQNTKKTKYKSKKNEPTNLKSLNQLREDGLIYGIQNGLNILYDTTLVKTRDKIKANIMPILETYNKEVKYRIVVILVTAEVDDIKKRLKERHEKMILEEEPYIRAVSPKLVKKFVEENKDAFDKARTYYESGSYEQVTPNTSYTSEDFLFKEIYNPQIKPVIPKIKTN
jgi:broad-specificity NMP kinase